MKGYDMLIPKLSTTIYLYTQVVFDFDYFRVYTELLWARLKL